jgi:hypothetical protein
VFNERTELVLDFNIALTGFDCQSMSMARTLQGFLPATPVTTAHAASANDACQRNPNAGVYSPPVVTGEYLRIRPVDTATDLDNTLATTLYPQPAWPAGSDFAKGVLDSLDVTDDSIGCGGVDGNITNPIHGYLVIDHANYCNLSNPSDPLYYSRDAIGMENNLFGEVIFTSATGLPTSGGSTVNIEADRSLDGTDTTDSVPKRTFYRRYWSITGPPAEIRCTNCGSGVPGHDLDVDSPWNTGVGDLREPLGLKYASRWFQNAAVSTFFRVWRGGSGSRKDLTGPIDADTGLPLCANSEPAVILDFFDEDEHGVSTDVCPSPCSNPPVNFPLETQRTPVTNFTRPPGAIAGWVSMRFFNPSASTATKLDQAWVEYEFNGATAFLSVSAPGTQLDPSTCNPLAVPSGIVVVTPVIPTVPTGTGK